jgi:hypothetical protein
MGLQAQELMSHMELAFRPGSFCLIFVLLKLQSSFSLGHDFPPRGMPISATKSLGFNPCKIHRSGDLHLCGAFLKPLT